MAKRNSTRANGSRIPAVGYIRMSTDKQEDSPEQQRAEIIKLAKREGYRIIRWYEDHAISGAKTHKRKQFRQMIRDAEDVGDFKAILCWDQDRFGRFDSIEAGEWISPLRRVGVQLVTVVQGRINWEDFAGRMIYQITQEGKNQFLVSLSNNVLRGMIDSARAGQTIGPIPYGYDKVYYDESGALVHRVVGNGHFSKPKAWKSRLDISENEQEVETVKWMFDQYANTDANSNSITRELNRRGIPTRNGIEWQCQSARVILRNLAYIGLLVYGKRPQGRFNQVGNGGVGGDGPIIVKNAHPPLIDQRTFERVQQKLAKRRGRQRRSRLNNYLLSGLLICGNTGERMFGRRATVGNCVQYYGARDSKEPGGSERCFGIRKDWLERLVISKVVEILDSPDLERRLRDAIAKRLQANKKATGDAKAVKQRIAALDKKIAKGVKRLLLLDGDDLSDASALLAGWRHERRRLIEDITLYWGPGGPRKWRLKRGVIRLGENLLVVATSGIRDSDASLALV